MPNNYNKPPLTVYEQIDLLVSRGIINISRLNTTFAAQAAMMHLLLNVISPKSKWTNRLYELIKNHSFINPGRMGFSSDWQNDVFWEIESYV
jgi:hypothetical protein